MINQLVKGIKEKDAPIVVGLDPMLSYVPKHLVKGAVDFFNEFVFFLIDGKISVFSLGNDESFARLRLNGNAVERKE